MDKQEQEVQVSQPEPETEAEVVAKLTAVLRDMQFRALIVSHYLHMRVRRSLRAWIAVIWAGVVWCSGFAVYGAATGRWGYVVLQAVMGGYFVWRLTQTRGKRAEWQTEHDRLHEEIKTKAREMSHRDVKAEISDLR